MKKIKIKKEDERIINKNKYSQLRKKFWSRFLTEGQKA